MTRQVHQPIVQHRKPPRPVPVEKSERQAQAIAAQLAYCMAEHVSPRNVRLGEQETAAVVGFPVAAHVSGAFQLPLHDEHGRRRLSDLLQCIKAMRPAVWDRAVEIAGGVAWRRFEMRLVARAATLTCTPSRFAGSDCPRPPARTPHSQS